MLRAAWGHLDRPAPSRVSGGPSEAPECFQVLASIAIRRGDLGAAFPAPKSEDISSEMNKVTCRGKRNCIRFAREIVGHWVSKLAPSHARDVAGAE
eukprot:9502218-Pyramimonas_sp.AAC.1